MDEQRDMWFAEEADEWTEEIEEEAGEEVEEEAPEGAGFSVSELIGEAMELHRLYPDFDPAEVDNDPAIGPYLRGELRPTMRQLYEAAHLEEIVASRVERAVSEAVSAAVEEAVRGARESAESQAAEAAERMASAVRESEERLLGHIRARGHRPTENGVRGEGGVRLHPAVERLTRRDRALLASRAERGEHIKL